MPSAGEQQKKSRILIIVENLPVPADRRVWMEATTLAQAGYDVTVVCPTGRGFNKRNELLEGVKILRHPLREGTGALGYLREYLSALYWEYRLSLRAVRENGRFDVIHICNPPDLLFLVARLHKLLYRSKVVFDHHDLGPELFVAKFGKKGLLYQAMKWVEYLTFRTADAVISTNESYRQIALERGGKAADAVTIVRSGPALDRFVRRYIPDDSDTITVGYVGVIGEQDGVDYLIRAWHHVVNELGRRDLRLVVIGQGPALDSLVKLAAELKVDDSVTFAGFLDDSDFMNTLSSFDIGVCPDPKDEFNDKCTMNKILEYMALGIPVVQFDLTEGRRSAAEAAVYATPNEPESLAQEIVNLADQPDLRRQMGEIGISRMRNELSWEHSAPKLLEAYEAVLAS